MRRLNAAGDWLALRTTHFQGTWVFLFIHFAWWLVWMNFVESRPFELLTLCVSLEAIVQTSLVAMGQRLLTAQVAAATVEAPKSVATVTCRHCRERA